MSGILVGFAVLAAGPVVGLLGIVILVALVAMPARLTALGGFLTGFGGVWLAIFGRVAVTCRDGCYTNDLTPWLIASAVVALAGVLLTVKAATAQR